MSYPTYTARLDIFKREMSTTAATIRCPAEFAIFNKYGSGKKVHLQNFCFNELSTNIVGTTLPSYITMQRISAHTVNEERLMTAVKHDSSNASLPSQVVACRFPDTVTTTGAPLRRTTKGVNYASSIAFSAFCSRFNKGGTRAEWADSMYSNINASTQYQVLREGEGISIHCSDTNTVTVLHELCVGVRNQSTGACYLYKIPYYSHFLPIFSLMNGSGSGVVLEVISVTQQDVGSGLPGRWNLEPISAVQSYHIDEVSIFPHDSTLPLDSNIVVTETAEVVTKFVSTTDMPSYKAFSNATTDGLNRVAANGANIFLTDKSPQRLFAPVGSKTSVVLEEGQGIALINRGDSAIGMYSVVCTFCVEDVEVAAAGEVFF